MPNVQIFSGPGDLLRVMLVYEIRGGRERATQILRRNLTDKEMYYRAVFPDGTIMAETLPPMFAEAARAIPAAIDVDPSLVMFDVV